MVGMCVCFGSFNFVRDGLGVVFLFYYFFLLSVSLFLEGDFWCWYLFGYSKDRGNGERGKGVFLLDNISYWLKGIVSGCGFGYLWRVVILVVYWFLVVY